MIIWIVRLCWARESMCNCNSKSSTGNVAVVFGVCVFRRGGARKETRRSSTRRSLIERLSRSSRFRLISGRAWQAAEKKEKKRETREKKRKKKKKRKDSDANETSIYPRLLSASLNFQFFYFCLCCSGCLCLLFCRTIYQCLLTLGFFTRVRLVVTPVSRSLTM